MTEDGNRWTYKFEKLEVYQLALAYVDLVYALAEKMPPAEQYNLRSQITRAATSIVLNIAEGSTSQTDAEQVRFLGMALRSLIETVACLDISDRRRYVLTGELDKIRTNGQMIFAKLQAMRRSLSGGTGTSSPVSRPQSPVKPS
jgi:four helix bundle protein